MVQGEFWPDGIGKFAVQVKLGDFSEMSTATPKQREGCAWINCPPEATR